MLSAASSRATTGGVGSIAVQLAARAAPHV
jgi:hypothetical protein